MSATRDRPLQGSSAVFGFREKGQGFVVVADFQLTLNFLVVEVEDCRHCFCNAEL